MSRDLLVDISRALEEKFYREKDAALLDYLRSEGDENKLRKQLSEVSHIHDATVLDDLVRDANVFSGGAILPGVPMMLRLLGQAADMLPTIDADELTDLPSLPGRNTEQAMRCGTASALVGGAQHLVNRYRQAHGPSTLIVLSGGDGTRLALHLPPPIEVVPHLVLYGLVLIAKQSTEKKFAG